MRGERLPQGLSCVFASTASPPFALGREARFEPGWMAKNIACNHSSHQTSLDQADTMQSCACFKAEGEYRAVVMHS